MKKTCLLLIVMCVCIFTACRKVDLGTELGTAIEFSFSSDEPTSEYVKKTIYLDDSREKIELDTSLIMDSGKVSMQVVSVNDETVIWENSYEQSADFSIVLNDLVADSEYDIKVQTINTQNVNITMTSTDDLVKEKEKPSKTVKDKEKFAK